MLESHKRLMENSRRAYLCDLGDKSLFITHENIFKTNKNKEL
ncbi:hypothetical protein METHB2_210003 [Candidatus Methylobacter favarea]|uniref:Uncharacterized protein n=1 Tax=Candidatus Methylobacter favarea TaxID=2707345 RepID=A0A8S0WI75_9GAMM|nr:hypothetical protein METHB2_210003 [Candidatus Methylobacter favarea]